MDGSRAEVLGKIRLALAKPRPEHHHGHRLQITDLRKLFTSVGSREGLLEKFGAEFERVSGEFTTCPSREAMVEVIKNVIVSTEFKSVAISRHEICDGLLEKLKAELPEVHFLREDIDSENPFARKRLREALSEVQLSITGAEYLLADSGTILVCAGSQASRQISLLPTAHLVLAHARQIYPNIAEAFLAIQQKHGTTLPGSALTLITGPSRTADIEKVLIKGVHGPTRILAIILT